jgi:hypothetical protein
MIMSEDAQNSQMWSVKILGVNFQKEKFPKEKFVECQLKSKIFITLNTI